ncbi:MAG: putative ABC transport system ATP-binding protein [Arenicella sp.]|jgi:putative ABC transport system ATP-binding protein
MNQTAFEQTSDSTQVVADSIKDNAKQNVVASLSGINKSYQLGEVTVHALRNINLTINQGQFTAIYGPSGSGKSTLLNLIGLVDEPDSGELSIMNSQVTGLNDNKLAEFRNSHIGYVFQNFNLLPMFNALENVMLPLQIGKSKSLDIKQRALSMLEKVGLADKANVRPDNLSGGQQQRVAIARALVGEPDIIVADEPTANLDSKSSQNVIQLMRDLNNEFNTTILISTHDQRVLSQVSSKIELVDGQISEGVSK